jgi:predicted ATP-grasp superfamily ATP-dependent carboligase
MPKRKSSSGKYGCGTLSVVISLVVLGAVLFASSKVHMTIHSCSIYTPSYLSALSGIGRALWEYSQREGAYSLVEVFLQLVKSEVLNLPPYYSIERVQGKRLLMVGGGYIPEFLSHAKLLGVEIHLIDDPKMAERTRGLVTSFIPLENFGRVSITNMELVLERVRDTGGRFDGVFTLVEDEGPLVSYLASHLKLVGNSEAASGVARNKYAMRQAMERDGLPVPKFALIEREEDLEGAVERIGLPIFLKPVFGVAASFAAKATTLPQLKELYRSFQKDMDPNDRFIYNFGTQMIVEEVIDGSEIQLELMIHGGEVVFHCFSSEYSSRRDWLVFPVNLTEPEKARLLDLAVRTVKAIGLTNGVVHIEMFNSTKGPQVIEVNNRLSRGFLPRRFTHQLLFGERLTDYFGSVIFLALGERPPAKERQMAPVSIAIFLDHPSLTGWETECDCAIFFGPSPADSLSQGVEWVSRTQ